MISDNDLLLYYYRDGLDAPDRERIAKSLSEQPELAARLHRLVARLDAVAMTLEVPVPEHVQQRWRAALSRDHELPPLRQRGRVRQGAAGEETAADKPRSEIFARFRWQIAAAAIAGVLAIMSLRVAMQSTPDGLAEDESTMQVSADPAANDSSAYERGLRVHLANTEFQLASLDSASDEERSRLIETIIAQNRLYAIAAERAGEPQLARVLRAFTPILERLADGGGDETADESAQLSFELNVMQARLSAATSNKSSAQSLAL
jgi:hypothetical protein